MKTIVLVSCSKQKSPRRARAKDLYLGPLFKLSLRYARSLDPDAVYVLSAKHGLVGLEEELEPYDLTLNGMRSGNVKRWAEYVLRRLSVVSDLRKDRFVLLAGETYRKHLMPHISDCKVPIRGLGIGRQMRFLKENVHE